MQTNLVTDSEHFYNSILELLDNPDKMEEVNQLLTWWNQYVLYSTTFRLHSSWTSQIFPLYADTERAPSKNSPLARIRAKQVEQRELAVATSQEGH